MDNILYILIADKSGSTAIRKLYYVYAPSMKEAWDTAQSSPELNGWTVRNVQPTTLGRRNGWNTIGGNSHMKNDYKYGLTNSRKEGAYDQSSR